MRGGSTSRSVRTRSLWIDRPRLGAFPAQTREPKRASVPAEGGGTATPTLGGGLWFSREHSPVGGEVPR
jgi:hypothetical protein